jgi:hypothetical protein
MDEKYTWQAAYRAAILKTESAAMPLRIYEALSAIEQRRLSDIETDSEEDSALKNAVRGIRALRAERLGSIGRNRIHAASR